MEDSTRTPDGRFHEDTLMEDSTRTPDGRFHEDTLMDPSPSPRTLWFEEVEVRRARGIGVRKGFRLRHLVPGINLISGSNGSGKTTTALAIQELLWPGETELEHPSLTGILRDGDAVVELGTEAGFPTLRRDGREARENGWTAFAPAESRTRHHLALPDLLRSTDQDFAKRVADASRGGYDLTGAAHGLGFTHRPSAPRARSQAVDGAERELRDAQQRQHELLRRSDRVADLERALDQARKADREARRLERLLAWWDAAEECRRLEAEVAAFPTGIGRLRGDDERERLQALRDRRERIRLRLGDARRESDEAVTRLRETGLPEEGLDALRLAAWSTESADLARLEARRMEARRVAAGASAEVERRRRDLGPQVSDEALAALDDEARQALDALSDEAETLRLEGLRLRTRRRELEGGPPRKGQGAGETVALDTLRDGIRTLGRWLQAPPRPRTDPGEEARRRLRLRLQVAAAVVALLFVVLAVVSHPLWALGVLVGAALLVGADERADDRPGDRADDGANGGGDGRSEGVDDRAVHRRTFEATDLPAPERWDEGTVAAHLETLSTELQRAIREEARQSDLLTLAREEEEFGRRRTAMDGRRQELARRLGIPLGEPTFLPRWLPELVRSAAGWREARARAVAAEGEAEALDGEWERRFRDLLAELALVTEVGVETGAAAQGLVAELAHRDGLRGEAVRARTAALRTIRQLEEESEESEREEMEFWARLGLGSGDEATLTEWLEQRPAWTRVRDELLRTRALRDGIRQEPDLPTPDPGLTRVAIGERLTDARARAQRRDELIQEITAIRTEVRNASQGTRMADLLARRDAALVALADERDGASEQVAGFQVLEFIRAEESERSRPAVLRRASRLLARFTQGLFELEVQDAQGEPAFRVRGGDGPSRPLDQLSGGERIQTLMAVRLAFLEEEESVQLPLLLDEALATSDDERITRIVDAVREIARGGRQVFCFTAQPTEVARWRARLKGADVSFRHFDLDQVRGRDRTDAFPPTLTLPRPRDVPHPNGDDRKVYGRRLVEAGLVDGIDPWARSAHGLHLWHLVEDPELLHRLLDDGIHRWGPLARLARGAPEFVHGLGVDEISLDALAVRARAVERAIELWRIGRAPPVDREVLTGAAGVSETFLDRVVALADDCAGDGASLVARLAAGELSRWRQENTGLLREWLEAEGYLDPAPRLTLDELRIRLLEGCRRDLSGGRLDTSFLDRVIHGLPRDPVA